MTYHQFRLVSSWSAPECQQSFQCTGIKATVPFRPIVHITHHKASWIEPIWLSSHITRNILKIGIAGINFFFGASLVLHTNFMNNLVKKFIQSHITTGHEHQCQWTMCVTHHKVWTIGRNYKSEFMRIHSYKHLSPQIDCECFNGVLSKLWLHLWSNQHFPNRVAWFQRMRIRSNVHQSLLWSCLP